MCEEAETGDLADGDVFNEIADEMMTNESTTAGDKDRGRICLDVVT